MSYIQTEQPSLWTSLIRGEVPTLSIDLFKAFWVNLADLKIYSARFNDQNTLELVTLNLPEIGLLGTNLSSASKAIVDTTMDVDKVILGAAFTPILSKEPINLTAFVDGSPIQGLAWSYSINGSVYDITLYPTEDFTNLKINVQC